ncbi:MAG: hypothetical protein QXT45_01230 [Candidatus Bilamarchaeaceae archaeon]
MENTGLPVRKYRFLLTIARRAGVDDIRAKAVLSCTRKQIEIKLPGDIDGSKVESIIKAAMTKHGFRKVAICRYLGSELKKNRSSSTYCFKFLVSAE